MISRYLFALLIVAILSIATMGTFTVYRQHYPAPPPTPTVQPALTPVQATIVNWHKGWQISIRELNTGDGVRCFIVQGVTNTNVSCTKE